jgi:hypothetical protein
MDQERGGIIVLFDLSPNDKIVDGGPDHVHHFHLEIDDPDGFLN